MRTHSPWSRVVLRGALALGLLLTPLLAGAQRIALTFDDGFDPRVDADAERHNAAILAALTEHGVQAMLFATGTKVDNPIGIALVKAWSDAGHPVANHGYAHFNLNGAKATLEHFSADAERNAALLSGLPTWQKRFRFPYLKEGATPSIRDGARHWLRTHGYASGAVSVDTSDWYYDQRMREWLKNNQGRDPSVFRKAYLDHLLERANYYGALARQVVGRDVDHVLLLHTNAINARFLGDVISAFRNAGWEIVVPEVAFKDLVYERAPNVLPAGESLIWSLAKEAGAVGLRYPAEDGPYEKAKLDELGL